jgi:ABC-type uncharacterized transport system, permease component
MSGVLASLLGALSQGILWGIMALGVYITFRVLDIADLTVDGSFATGGSVCAVAIVSGIHPLLAILLAILAGMLTGFVTGVLIARFEIPAILAGILTQIGLYSINLRIMGRSNLPLLRNETLFRSISNMTGLSIVQCALIVGVGITIIAIMILYWFFGTEIGAAIRATGNNEKMASALGVNTRTVKIIGLMISNGFIAFSGALITQSQGYADVKMGTGAIVIGLASIVIGEVLIGSKHSFGTRLVAIVIGSIIYRVIIALVLRFGLNTDDLQLVSATLVGISLVVPILISKQKQVNLYRKLTGKDNNHA